MRNIIALLALTLFLARPCVSDASYLIKLKNGREFVTSRYWEEGGQIKFYSHGGVIGIDKNLVGKIKESDRPFQHKEEGAVQPGPGAVEKSNPQPKEDPFAKAPKKTLLSEEAKKAETQFGKQFEVLKERSSRIEAMTAKELQKFLQDLSDFKKKVISSKLAHHYTSQLTEIYAIGDKVEALLKSKGQ